MDIFDEDLLNYWRCLNKNAVEYIMVGGVAVNFNGYNRATDDIDVWINDTIENREQYRKAFKEYCGIDLDIIDRLQIIPGWTNFQLKSGFKLDLFIKMKGLEEYSFDQCYKLANVADLNGVTIPFLHINHLLANKRAVNRPKDQVDIIYLEKIMDIQKGSDQ